VSPYDTEARYRARSGRDWIGYMVHLTETCDADRPHLIVHADTTPANVHDVMRLEPIHMALARKELLPREHLVDAATSVLAISLGLARSTGSNWSDPAART
jgi:IS5 family transposase